MFISAGEGWFIFRELSAESRRIGSSSWTHILVVWPKDAEMKQGLRNAFYWFSMPSCERSIIIDLILTIFVKLVFIIIHLHIS